MKKNVLIIGAGISGVSIAYNLALKGVKDIHVVDKSHFCAGATGRCGAGVRSQWATPLNCLLAKKSIDFFEHAQTILDYHDDIEFKQEGYLILATTDKEAQDFQANVKLQNSMGIPSKYLSVDEALKIVPYLNRDAFVAATFCGIDGHLNPFKMTDAYLQAARRLGVTFSFFEEVRDIMVKDHQVVGVKTDKETYETHIVVNAAGGYSHEIGRMAGIDIPVYSENHQILATEPIEKIQGPMVMSFTKNIYCQQVPHGSFIMGRGDPSVAHGHEVDSSWRFLDDMAKTVTHIMPLLGNLRVVRQWGGSYNMSPDRQPIIGGTDELEGFYMACGFSGHGFMLAPMTGLLLAEIILKQPTTVDTTTLDLRRFHHQQAIDVEKSVV